MVDLSGATFRCYGRRRAAVEHICTSPNAAPGAPAAFHSRDAEEPAPSSTARITVSKSRAAGGSARRPHQRRLHARCLHRLRVVRRCFGHARTRPGSRRLLISAAPARAPGRAYRPRHHRLRPGSRGYRLSRAPELLPRLGGKQHPHPIGPDQIRAACDSSRPCSASRPMGRSISCPPSTLRPALVAVLARYVLMAVADLQQGGSILASSVTMSAFEQFVISALLLSHPHTYSDALRRLQTPIAPRDVRRAIDYMEAHLRIASHDRRDCRCCRSSSPHAVPIFPSLSRRLPDAVPAQCPLSQGA